MVLFMVLLSLLMVLDELVVVEVVVPVLFMVLEEEVVVEGVVVLVLLMVVDGVAVLAVLVAVEVVVVVVERVIVEGLAVVVRVILSLLVVRDLKLVVFSVFLFNKSVFEDKVLSENVTEGLFSLYSLSKVVLVDEVKRSISSSEK